MHPGVDTAQVIVRTIAEIFYLHTVSRMDGRSKCLSALRKGR